MINKKVYIVEICCKFIGFSKKLQIISPFSKKRNGKRTVIQTFLSHLDLFQIAIFNDLVLPLESVSLTT